MDRKYFIDNLKHIAYIHGINVDDETIDKFVNVSIFRIISKGEVIASIGDDTSLAGLVLSGITRCYYIDNNGNDNILNVLTSFFTISLDSSMIFSSLLVLGISILSFIVISLFYYSFININLIINIIFINI